MPFAAPSLELSGKVPHLAGSSAPTQAEMLPLRHTSASTARDVDLDPFGLEDQVSCCLDA